MANEPVFRTGPVRGGAISAGACTAGALDILFEALDASEHRDSDDLRDMLWPGAADTRSNALVSNRLPRHKGACNFWVWGRAGRGL